MSGFRHDDAVWCARRAEQLGLRVPVVRRLELEQGSFELVYWRDALARVLDRAGQHAYRWQQDQQNQQYLVAC